MADYEITGPDGGKYQITAPEGATQDDVMEYAKKNWGVASQSEPKEMGWGDAAISAVKNTPESAVKFATDLVHPIIHPIDTLTGLKNLGMGVLQKTGLASGSDYEQHADAVGRWLVDRYGSIDAVKRTLATDPVGLASDVSMILSGGATAAGRLPGVAGKVAQVAGRAATVIDPLTSVGLAAKGVGAIGSEVLGGLALQTGGAPLRAAYSAGREGGQAAEAFQSNLRGTVPAEDAVQAARKGLTAMILERGDVYRDAMKKIGADKEILDFDKIDDALIKATEVKTYKGVDLSPSTSEIRSKMAQDIQQWKMLDPKEFHTPEGIDALKRKLSDYVDATEPGSAERKVASDIYRSVRQTIIDQVPEYKKVMEAYEQSSDLIKQMEKTLSLNPGASIDTSLRKLQSVLRNNVSTSYGHRAELAKFLVNAGAPNLIERLAGQALQPMLPRGLGRLGAEIGLIMHPTVQGASMLGVASPRVMGEAAYYAGKAAPYAQPAGRALFQIGRASSPMEELSDQASQNTAGSAQLPMPGARRAPDGKWYLPDASRPGKYLEIRP